VFSEKDSDLARSARETNDDSSDPSASGFRPVNELVDSECTHPIRYMELSEGFRLFSRLVCSAGRISESFQNLRQSYAAETKEGNHDEQLSRSLWKEWLVLRSSKE
jgi:hypothetical protein